MLGGDLYNALDPKLTSERTRARLLISRFNSSPEDQPEERAIILKDLIPHAGNDFFVQPPFYCDYGSNIYCGEKVYFNFNCVVLDVMRVTIGDRCMFGPQVQIYTATHPLHWKDRSSGLEFAKSVIIGHDVWVGGNTIICPGVRIGDRSIIGAGSVITKDIPSDVMAAGNPCRVIRTLDPGE